MNALFEVRLYRDAGEVKRYHTQRTHRTQSLAEHTFNMLMLVKQVQQSRPGHVFRAQRVYEAIMHHDLPELYTGDVPATVKRASPGLKALLDKAEEQFVPLYQDFQLSPCEEVLIKWADRIESVLWCMEEISMGNKAMAQLVRRLLGWLLLAPIPPGAEDITTEVVSHASSFGIHPAKGEELEKAA